MNCSPCIIKQQQKIMKRAVKIFLGFGLVAISLSSCGGHTLCDAYGYLEYENEKEEINKKIYNIEVEETEELSELG